MAFVRTGALDVDKKRLSEIDTIAANVYSPGRFLPGLPILSGKATARTGASNDVGVYRISCGEFTQVGWTI